MSKIAILTDSSCDIPQEMAEKYGIDIMSFHILLDDVDYVERVDCTNTEFYDKMRAAKGVPSTAAITPIQFCEKYCQYVDEGYTDVIHVPINKSGSSTYNNALMAQGMLREERPEHHLNIHLLDPHTYSMVFGWYLCEMARKLQNGAEIRHVIHEFERQMNCMEVVLGPYSLRQMKKSGRISAAAAVMGELMGIRPIITLIDGKTPVIISFWSTTCKPCIKELDAISEQMIDWLDEADFRVVAVSVDDSRSISRAKALAASRGWTTDLMVAYDKNQDFKRALNVNVTPHVFIFDKDGKMVYSHTSYLPGGEMELIQKIKTLQ